MRRWNAGAKSGFETALFLRALVLEAGSLSVLVSVALGLSATFAVGFVVFQVQTKLPYKKMLVVTAVMGGVLLIMVGNTANALQVVGWLPTHPLRFAEFPYRAGLRFGLYATWEGLVLQTVAGSFRTFLKPLLESGVWIPEAPCRKAGRRERCTRLCRAFRLSSGTAEVVHEAEKQGSGWVQGNFLRGSAGFV